MTSEEPPKFITEAGIRKMNPAWKAWKNGQSSAPAAGTTNHDSHETPLIDNSSNAAPVVVVAPTMANEATALPVVSNMQQLSQLGANTQTTQRCQEALDRYQSAETAAKVGLTQEQMLEQIGRVFAKYEIPIGLLQKLFILETFDLIDAIFDNSGSMGCGTDSKWPDGRQMTRWEEALQSIKRMTELIAYVPFPPIHIRFLNGGKHFVLEKK